MGNWLAKGKRHSKLNRFDEEPIMTPDVIQVTALPNYKLQIQFENGELKVFDMAAYLRYQAFSSLRESNVFMQAKVSNGTVGWTEEIDISPDTLYVKGKSINPALRGLSKTL
jgi:Protein of unknown function (DUF2442)